MERDLLLQQLKRFHETLNQRWVQNPVRPKGEAANAALFVPGNAIDVGLNAMGPGSSSPDLDRLTGKTLGRISRVTNAAKKIGSSLFIRRRNPVVMRKPKTQNTAPSISLMPMNTVSQITKAQVKTIFSQPKSNLSFGASPPALIVKISWLCICDMTASLSSKAPWAMALPAREVTSAKGSTQALSPLYLCNCKKGDLR